MHCRSFVCVSLYQCCVLVKKRKKNLTLLRLLEKVTKCFYSNCEVRDRRSQCTLSQYYKTMQDKNNAISVSCYEELLQFYCCSSPCFWLQWLAIMILQYTSNAGSKVDWLTCLHLKQTNWHLLSIFCIPGDQTEAVWPTTWSTATCSSSQILAWGHSSCWPPAAVK